MSHDLFGAPATLTGQELVTIRQMQNGYLVRCTMTLSTLLAWIQAQGGSVGLTQTQFNTMAGTWVGSLPTTAPAHGPWNDSGVISYVP